MITILLFAATALANIKGQYAVIEYDALINTIQADALIFIAIALFIK